MSLRREVENGQPSMPQRELGIAIDPCSGIIGTSVSKGAGHTQSNGVQLIAFQPAGRIEKSR